MKFIAILIFTFSVNLLYSQITVTGHFPRLPKKVYIISFNSLSGTLYTGLENRFIIETPEYKSRDIVLALDTTDLHFEVDWAAYSTQTSNSNTASGIPTYGWRLLGQTNKEATNEYDRHTDTKTFYWEKENIIESNVAQEVNITLYIRETDTSYTLYESIVLLMKHPPKPELQIENVNYFKLNKKITPIFDEDFITGKDWYKIRTYNFVAYDKKDRILHKQTVIGDMITPEMVRVLKDKKLHHIKLSNLKSDKFEFDDIVITVN